MQCTQCYISYNLKGQRYSDHCGTLFGVYIYINSYYNFNNRYVYSEGFETSIDITWTI